MDEILREVSFCVGSYFGIVREAFDGLGEKLDSVVDSPWKIVYRLTCLLHCGI